MSTRNKIEDYESIMFSSLRNLVYIGLPYPEVKDYRIDKLKKDERILRILDSMVYSAKLAPASHKFAGKEKK